MARWEDALASVELSIEDAWRAFGAERQEAPDDLAREVLAHLELHEWRLVDAALDHLVCSECGSLRLGSGPKGCPECDFADGFRFAAQEIDRPGVPPGNEHAIRVSSAVLRAPNRYPVSAVRGNELFLPLFLDGLMPTREQQERFDAAVKRGLPAGLDLSAARTFAGLVELATSPRR